MEFNHTKTKVANRGHPTNVFLQELVHWGRTADESVFAPRPSPNFGPDPDVYVQLKPILGPWTSLLHRRAAMLELMRVHAGFESSWTFGAGVDVTNHTSVTHPNMEETGIFQVSFDSTELDHDAMKPFAVEHGIGTVGSFLSVMKTDHFLAMDYYARLVRINTKWAGPIKRHEIDEWLSRDAVLEFESFL